MNGESNTLYCFLDTDVLLHFKTFDEVDWPEVLGVSSVFLVIAPAVLRELDNHKNDSGNAWRQKRARMLISKFRDLFRSASPGVAVPVRAGVVLLDLTREPAIDWLARGLDPNIGDDRLIASVIEWMANRESKGTRLISNDFLAQRKAGRFGIEIIDPGGLIDPIERASPEETRIKELHQKVQTLEGRLPKLEFGLEKDGVATIAVKKTILKVATGIKVKKDVSPR